MLKDEDEDAKAKQRMEQACTEEVGTMADIIDELFESANTRVLMILTLTRQLLQTLTWVVMTLQVEE